LLSWHHTGFELQQKQDDNDAMLSCHQSAVATVDAASMVVIRIMGGAKRQTDAKLHKLFESTAYPDDPQNPPASFTMLK
jgi:hypothetical protein